MQSRMHVPSSVGQSFPKMVNFSLFLMMTSCTNGKRLLGYQQGSSPSRQDQCAPQGLKYLREITFQSLCLRARLANNISTLAFDSPQGLPGNLQSLSLQLSLSPYTPAVDEKMKFLHYEYFSINLNKFIDPTTLFQQQSIGLAYDYPMAFFAAKCIMASMGSFCCWQSLNILYRNCKSRMLP